MNNLLLFTTYFGAIHLSVVSLKLINEVIDKPKINYPLLILNSSVYLISTTSVVYTWYKFIKN